VLTGIIHPESQQPTTRRAWAWAASHLPELQRIEPAGEDASFRAYYRMHSPHQSCILMQASEEKDAAQAFAALQPSYAKLGLHTPEILAASLNEGWLLLSDFGNNLLLHTLTEANREQHYPALLQQIPRIQRLPNVHPTPLMHFDETVMHEEWQLCWQWYALKHRGYCLSPGDAKKLYRTLDTVIASASAQPQAGMHRDFHSRNILCVTPNTWGIIDFQDSMIGPIAYDAVSLLKDCYVAWPQDCIDAWSRLFYDHAVRDHHPLSLDAWQHAFDLMGVQRHLKAMGIFARKYHRDHDDRYLPDLERTAQRLHRMCVRYPELDALRFILPERLP
jgi:N-acetylmuramate 1-kinase